MKKISPQGKFIATCIKLLGKLPLGFHYAMGKVVYGLLRLIKYRYDVILTNISRSFPELNYDDIPRIVKGFYKHFSDILAETIFFGGCDVERLEKSGIICFTGKDIVSASLKEGRSVMVLSSHLGNWELIGGIIDIDPDPLITKENVKVIYKKLHNEAMNDAMYLNRQAPFNWTYEGELETNEVVRYILTHKGETNVYVMITDQFPYQKGDPIRFMNQNAWTMTAAAQLARRLGMDIVNLNCLKLSKGKYEFRFTPCAKHDEDIEPIEVMRRYYDNLEKDIIAYPETYLWSHKRWRK